MKDWTYREAMSAAMWWRYGEGVQRVYDEQRAQAMRDYRIKQVEVFPEEIKAGAVLNHNIAQDIRQHGLDTDLPPSVKRMYSEYRERTEAAQVKADNARCAREAALRLERRLEAEHMRWLQRMGFSVQNYLNSKALR